MPVTINREPVKPVTAPITDVVLTSEGSSKRPLVFETTSFSPGHAPVSIQLPDGIGRLHVSTDTAREFALGLIELCDQIDGAR